MAAEKRNTQEGRIRTRPVRDDEAEEWAGELLARHGLRALNLAVSGARRFGDRRSVGFWVRDLLADVEVSDPDAAEGALRDGVGRGRAYGLGMVVVLAAEQSKRSDDAVTGASA
ncbi:type I-E CRISPR-associated protein Cas6/Cse3/CasE [Ornithinimicrobium sp. Y1847]|uniref:type I-E CRISPR-associated protein Cas6/Cse3/CasE n=1 Tax=Ornithinimicrobium sp. Y1847 TaxID=3405419 RepID=UPI003CFECC40